MKIIEITFSILVLISCIGLYTQATRFSPTAAFNEGYKKKNYQLMEFWLKTKKVAVDPAIKQDLAQRLGELNELINKQNPRMIEFAKYGGTISLRTGTLLQAVGLFSALYPGSNVPQRLLMSISRPLISGGQHLSSWLSYQLTLQQERKNIEAVYALLPLQEPEENLDTTTP